MQYNFASCVGQSYDGAAVMANEQSGVISIVQNESPLAYYFRCTMHSVTKRETLKGGGGGTLFGHFFKRIFLGL